MLVTKHTYSASSQSETSMSDRILIPLPGIGTLSLTRAEYDAALIPLAKPELPQPARRPEPPTPTTHAPPKSSGLRYLRLREVCERVGVGTSTIYKMMATGAFPRQVKLSVRTAAWIESEVEAFMNARITERDQPVPTPDVSPYLRMGEVMRLTGMTHAMIYDGVRAKAFPKWADLPKRASEWLRSDIEAWLAARNNNERKKKS
jgi:prophage regulatory protein